MPEYSCYDIIVIKAHAGRDTDNGENYRLEDGDTEAGPADLTKRAGFVRQRRLGQRLCRLLITSTR